MAWALVTVGSLLASPVCLGIHILIVQEVIRWFRRSPRLCHASPARGPRWSNPKLSWPCVVRAGRLPGASACSRPSPPYSSSCCRFCLGTPRAALCPIRRAYDSRRQPPVKRGPHSRGASLTAASSASEPRCSAPPEMKRGGMGIAPFSSRARAAPCLTLRPCRRRSVSQQRSGRGAAFPWPISWGGSRRAPECS
jgi:hypothetical protein